MYTLRIFEEIGEIGRTQIYLGETYSVIKPSDEDEKQGITLRVLSSKFDDGFAIYKNQYAFVMSENGQTFETLNRPLPKSVTPNSSKKYDVLNNISEINIMNKFQEMCIESLSPDTFDAWEKVSEELMNNRTELKGKKLDRFVPDETGSM